MFFLKILRLGALWISGSSLFYWMITDRMKSIFKEAVFVFELKNIISVSCKVWSGL